ncbi:MAG: hypothetical protein J0H66_11445 [Solirubrobacterales bacterium]|nr:hypothetical protein [Solirubrobacterales bacterium]
MTAVTLFIVGISLGFLLPRFLTLSLTALVPLYYVGLHLSLWGDGVGEQWLWAMVFLYAVSFFGILFGVLLGGGNRMVRDRDHPTSV